LDVAVRVRMRGMVLCCCGGVVVVRWI